MRVKKQLSCCIFLLLGFTGYSSERTSEYIERYRKIAIYEMKRSQIPASITLAQAIHESAWGQGDLALNSNNFFGIKCKDYWQGKRYYKTDDDYDENNQLTKSCFRAYPNVEASFKDHSDFLTNSERYSALFLLEITNYKGWAKGLQACGYATDPEYALKLIKTIEKFDLHKLDAPQSTTVTTEEVLEQPIYQINLNLLEENTAAPGNEAPQSVKITQVVRKWENRREKYPEAETAVVPVSKIPVNSEREQKAPARKQEKMIRVNGSSRQIILTNKPRSKSRLRK